MKIILQVLKNKFSSLLNNKIAFSSIIIDSYIDKRSAVRQKARLYHVSIDKYSYICRNTLIQNSRIGAFCSISENCIIGMPSHPIYFISTSPVFLNGSNYLKKNFSNIIYDDCPITYIGNDVWIGANVLIKSGVKIGNGAVIAAGAAVKTDVDAYDIVGGVTAKVIKYRFDKITIERIRNTNWWEWSENKIIKNADSFAKVEKFLEL